MKQPSKFDDLTRQEESAFLDEDERYEDDVYDVPYWDEDGERAE